MRGNRINMGNECYECANMQSIPGNAHIQCINPDINMTGDGHGIKMGWFMYPFAFDPVWKTRKCNNFKSKGKGVKN